MMTIPFGCVAAAFALVYLAKVPAGLAQQKLGYDNRHPRDQQAKLEGWGKRALAAHQNAIEGFAPFAAAVIVAHLGGAEPRASAVLAVVYVVARVVYNVLYIADLSTLRSAVWGIGFSATAALFLLPAWRP